MEKFDKLILSIIAVSLITLNIQLFKGKINLGSEAHAVESHYHYSFEIFDLESSHNHPSHTHEAYDIYGLKGVIERCSVSEGAFNTYSGSTFGNSYDIDC